MCSISGFNHIDEVGLGGEGGGTKLPAMTQWNVKFLAICACHFHIYFFSGDSMFLLCHSDVALYHCVHVTASQRFGAPSWTSMACQWEDFLCLVP